MIEENKEAVKEMMQKLKIVKHLQQKNISVEDRKEELRNKINKVVGFLQKDVIGASTSSLIRTNIKVGELTKNYSGGTSYEVLTINQNGIGTLRETTDKTVYCSPVSNPLRTDEFMKYIVNDKETQDKLLTVLKENNNRKMYKILTDVFNNVSTLGILSDVSSKYLDRATLFELKNKVEIIIPEMKVLNSSNESEATMKTMNIKSVIISDRGKIIGVNRIPNKKEIGEICNTYYYNNNNKHDSFVNIAFSEIEGNMIMIQVPYELDEMYKDIDETISIDEVKAGTVEDSIETEFATFKFAKEMKGDSK